ncbi:hypothetical protein NPIL_380191, partial [Nephila pilipes]
MPCFTIIARKTDTTYITITVTSWNFRLPWSTPDSMTIKPIQNKRRMGYKLNSLKGKFEQSSSLCAVRIDG